jgi:beta-glucanase (GH16 family)
MKIHRHRLAPPQLKQLRSTVGIVIAILFICTAVMAQTYGKLVWSDEFSGKSIDTNHWKFETGNRNGWGNHELEYYTDSSRNAYVSNGILHITARLESTNGLAYTSARMKSQGLFDRKYGRFEFRAKVPFGQGYWPAIWLMPEHSSYGPWPACGEIDVMENRGAYPAVVQGTIHYAGVDGFHLQSTEIFTFPQNERATDFHTYLLEWNTNLISWSVDGRLYETQTNWSTAKAAYPAPFDQPFYIIMNLAVGGIYGGNPDVSTVFPGELQVDYIRVYDNAPTNSVR